MEKLEIHCHKFFPSNQFIVKFFSKTLICRNICQKTVAVKLRNFNSVNGTVWKNEKKNTLTETKISSNQLFSNFFSKTVTFTNFFLKKCEMRVNLCNFLNVNGVIWRKFSDFILLLLISISREKATYFEFLHCCNWLQLISRKIFIFSLCYQYFIQLGIIKFFRLRLSLPTYLSK